MEYNISQEVLKRIQSTIENDTKLQALQDKLSGSGLNVDAIENLDCLKDLLKNIPDDWQYAITCNRFINPSKLEKILIDKYKKFIQAEYLFMMEIHNEPIATLVYEHCPTE